MRIKVFGGIAGPKLIKDLKLRVTFKNLPNVNLIDQVLPNSSIDQSGNLVYEQQLGQGATNAASQYIDSVELDSPTLAAILASFGLIILALVWVAFRKRQC